MTKHVNEINCSEKFFSLLFPELNYADYKELVCTINLEERVNNIKKLLPRYIKLTVKGNTKLITTVFKLKDIEYSLIIDHYKLILTGTAVGDNLINTGVKLSVNRCFIKDTDTLESATKAEFVDKMTSIIQKI